LAITFETIGWVWNYKKKNKYNKDEAIALWFFTQALTKEDATLINELQSAYVAWAALQAKYRKTTHSELTANITNLGIMKFDKEKGIHLYWAQIKEYRQKISLAN